MKQYIYPAVFIVFFMHFVLLPTVALFAAEEEEVKNPSAQEIAQKLADHLGSLESLSFSFNQKTMGQISGRARQASGIAYFSRIGGIAQMRWNYQTPDTQVILSDGTTLKMYFDNLNQMIVAPAESLQQDITYSFFTGESDLSGDFIIRFGPEVQKEEKGPVHYDVIELVPRSPTSQITFIRLWITDTTKIQRIEIQDTFDTITLLNISDIRENTLSKDGQLFDPQLFQFTPPKGTEIIYQ